MRLKAPGAERLQPWRGWVSSFSARRRLRTNWAVLAGPRLCASVTAVGTLRVVADFRYNAIPALGHASK